MQDLEKENPVIDAFELEASLLNNEDAIADNIAKEIIDRLVNLLLIEQVYFNQDGLKKMNKRFEVLLFKYLENY